MADQVIIRRKVTSNFTVLDNTLITDKRLSWKALGLLTFLLSLPPDFKLRLNHLSKQRRTGRDATRSGLKELEETGYLVIAVERHANGKFACTTWTVSDRAADVPHRAPTDCSTTSPRSENPKSATQEADKPRLVKPTSKKPTLTSSTTQKELTLQRTTTTEWPQNLKSTLTFPTVGEKDLQSIEKIISNVPAEIQQDLLDEIEGKRRAGKLRNGPIALARYLSQNIDSFLLIDGHSVRQQRESRTKQIAEETLRSNEAANKNIEFGRNLAKMSDDEFEEKHRNLPENIRKRIELLRQEEIYKLKNK